MIVDIQGYTFLNNYRVGRSGGGVGLYLVDNVSFKQRNDLAFSDNSATESLFVELDRAKEKNIIVGVIYRPPDQKVKDFLCDLDLLLDKISRENKIVYLLGDYNLNLLAHSRHQDTSKFLDLLYSRMFFPLITRPTRITEHRASLIDNIFTNDPLSQSVSGLFINDISDHLPIFSLISCKLRVDIDRDKFVSFRERSEVNLANFKLELENSNWAVISGLEDPSEAYRVFVDKYISIYNKCFPLKRVKAMKLNLQKPWLSKGLLKSVRKKNALYKCYLNNPIPENEHIYKKYKNKLNHSLKIAKRLYYVNQIERTKSNIKGTWKILNEILNRRKSKQRLPSLFRTDSQNLSDPHKIADHFCRYFSNIGPNLASKIPVSDKSHRSFLPERLLNSIFFEEVNENEIIEICGSLRSGAAAGYDGIPMNVVKQTIDLINYPLKYILNLSLRYGIVPDSLKIAKVIPLFKSGDHDIFSNYRPVSILPAFSKILEKVVYNRLLKFLNKFNILSDNQYGFRKHHSTAYALTHLYDKISSAIDNQEYTVGIFIDLSKAFDTVDHCILLEKLEHYGIRGSALNWFASYLSGRSQFVDFNGYRSSTCQIRCGVPQGSILGPLLFLIYINDICNVSKVLDFILFADDTNIFFSHKDELFLSQTLNSELLSLSEWCKVNKLSINLKKCNFMIFKPRQKRRTLDISVVLNNHIIAQTKEVVFLGVILDENLSWKPHILNVSRKISKSIGIIYKSSFCLSAMSLRTLYFSLVYPYLIYCITVWGSTYQTNLKRLITLQKKVIKIISNVPFDAHTDNLFRDHQILKFNDIYLFQTAKFMFLYTKGLLPNTFNNMFTLTNQIHSYNTRNSNCFYVFPCRTNIRRFSIRFRGPQFYNSLNQEIQNCESVGLFSKLLKKCLLAKLG